ncbi:MAG: hypothetical protein Q9181_000908 [Wetmoreana brouardii]
MRKYVVAEHLSHLTCLTSSSTLPTYLVPRILHRLTSNTQQHHGQVWLHRLSRRLATAAVDTHRQDDGAVEAAEKERHARRAMTRILQAPHSPNERPWISLLEPYLPHYLQRQGYQELQNASAKSGKPVPIQDLHVWLAEARKVKEPKGDLLTYLTIKEDRADAVVWLVEAMLRAHASELQNTPYPSSPRDIVRRQLPLPLEDITRSTEATERLILGRRPPGSSPPDLDALTESPNRSATHDCLGEIWRSVGSLILQAADRKPTSAKSKSIMACVHRILAHLHHVGAVPHSIYNYAPAADPSVLQRPPTLHYWSLRIMMVLSDAHWISTNPHRVSDGSTGLEVYDPNDPKGASLPSVDMGPLLPGVDPQIWLDFVLWCCVEGGWITEAAEVVYAMWSRRVEKRQYSVIDSSNLLAQNAPKRSWTERIKAAINRSRMREYAGGASFATDDDRVGFLKPPERTVSSEVIAAIVDALVNTASSQPELFGNNHSTIEKHISVCKIMLDRKHLGLGSASWNSIILRMFESLSSDPNTVATFLEPIVSWSPSFLQEPGAANSAYLSSSPAQTYVADPSAVSLGLLHRLLSDFILAGDFRGALRIFRRLQDIVDGNRRISLDNFPGMINQDVQQIGEEAVIRNSEQQGAPGLNLQLPSNVLAPFLDMITDVGCFDLGSWLLHSDDVDGCIIPPSMYSDPICQPALIRFASASGDEGLLEKVTQQLKAPLPEGTLRALLHYHIRRGKWDGVNEILELLRDGEGLAWDATDVVALARVILWRKTTPVASNSSIGLSPRALLLSLLRGRYNTARDPSQPRNLLQTRMLNQLARMLASVPNELGKELTAFCDTESNRIMASCTVPTRAFNMLLESVVGHLGVVEGKRLCERWCSSSDTARAAREAGNGNDQRVVKPDVRTFYNVLRPISQANLQGDRAANDIPLPQATDLLLGTNSSFTNKAPIEVERDLQTIQLDREVEQSVAEWGVARCLDLGVQWKDIKQDLPGLPLLCPDSNPHRVTNDPGGGQSIDSEALQIIGNDGAKEEALVG